MDDHHSLALAVLEAARSRNIMIAVAESCTGGMVASALTDIAGSSAIFDRGFITYSNAAKQEMLDVPEFLLARYGAVSSETAKAMAEGAVRNSTAQLSVSLTGIAGPGGGSDDKPVGTVFIASHFMGRETIVEHQQFPGVRSAVRQAATNAALKLLISQIHNSGS